MSWQVGDSTSITRTITDEMVRTYASSIGDNNPFHLDEEFAKRSRFGGRIAHGMLVASLFSTIIGTKLPGPGSLYLGQNLKFTAPVYIGEEVTATITIKAIREDKPIYTLDTKVTKPDGTVAIEGEAVALRREEDIQFNTPAEGA
jgi:3-hydroxybutyryl-CoA dehydratase